jgi:hypothetical protein
MRFGIVFAGFLAAAPLAAVAPRTAAAQDEPRLDDLEEQVLRQQVENYLNDFAHWDATQHRVVIGRAGRGPGGNGGGGQLPGELGGVQPLAEMILQKTIEPDGDGRLHLRENVKLRPFATVVQQYIADGGIDDIEKFQRFRNGDGENPFKNGLPPRVTKAVAGLMKALNEQTLDDGKKVEKRVEIRVREGARRDGDGDDRPARRDARRSDEPRRDDGRREESRRDDSRRGGGEQAPSDRARQLRERLAERLDMDPEELAELEKYARELADEARRDLERIAGDLHDRFQEFRESDRGRDLRDRAARLERRAEDEIRRALESEDVRSRLTDAQKRAMEFLASPEGQEMQRRFLEWLDSDNGRDVRRRVEEFMSSERGQDLLKRLGDRFSGRPQRPEHERGDGGRAQPETPEDRFRRAHEELRKLDEQYRREDEKLHPRKDARKQGEREQF